MSTSIGVRKLVEFILKKGNLTSNTNSQNTALDGISIHQRLQKKFSNDTKSEIALKKELDIDGETWIIHGRADGIKYIDDRPQQVIEIKTSSPEFSELAPNTLELYWAQAKIYAHIIMEQEQLPELSLKLIYVQTTDNTISEETLQLLVKHGLSITAITLTSKEQITFPEELDLADDENPYYLGYYDRLRPALIDILTNEKVITRKIVENYAKKHILDPFEFSLDISNSCDVVICDYNYLFDPLVKLQRFFTERNYDYTFLLDEAHNLVSRSRDMYTKEISSQQIKDLLDKLQTLPHPSQKIVDKLNTLLNDFDLIKEPLVNYQQADVIIEEKLASLTKKLMYFCDFTTDWLAENSHFSLKDDLLEFFFAAYTFVKISDYYNNSFRTHLFITENSELLIRVFCLDSSELIANSLNLGGSAVLFSATLSPLNYYQEMFGLIDNSLLYQLSSPFDESNLNLLITSYIPVTYQQRQQSLGKIIDTIHTMIATKQGNYLIFLPSYTFLKQVVVAFNQAYPHIDTVIQENDMIREQQEDFLNYFVENPTKILVGFAVLGGSFSEGIDLKGNRLSGVAIVSVGLPKLSKETNELQSYFNNKQKDGFQYAYQLPGLNNIFQAAGRVIRSSTDVGVVLLIDNRFATSRYAKFFPPHWKYAQIIHNQYELEQNLSTFWNKNKDS